MTRTSWMLLFLAAFSVPAAVAQAGPNETLAPRLTVSLGYANIHSNAPPSNCNCFGADGGYASAAYALLPWFRVAGEVTGSHASNIGPLGQDLTLMTYTAGPQVNLHRGRFDLFGQGLFGAGHGSDSYFPSNGTVSSSATSFALSAGGGLDIGLTEHLAIRPVQAEYLRTQFPNGATNVQTHLVLGAGVVFHFGQVAGNRADRERNKAYQEIGRQERAAEKAPPPAVVAQPVAAMQAPVTTSTVAADSASDFANAVKNAYFDYDSYGLRPDAQAAVDHDADYLKSHPQLHVVVQPGPSTGDSRHGQAPRIFEDHTLHTYEVLRRVPRMDEVARIARAHHERLDGSGYPDGLAAHQLMLPARILALAEAYEEAASDSAPSRTQDEVLLQIEAQIPHGLDRRCFEALQRVLWKRESIMRKR